MGARTAEAAGLVGRTLRAVGAAGKAEALLTPLPTFRSVPKGARQQLGDLFADLGEEPGEWPAESEEEATLLTGLILLSRWMLWAPTDGMPAHSPPAQREALRRDTVLTRIGLARAGQWQLLAQTAQREAERLSPSLP